MFMFAQSWFVHYEQKRAEQPTQETDLFIVLQ